MAATHTALLIEARNLLGVSQGGLGELLGSSRRTGQRWEAGGASPMPKQLHALAAMVHPKDPKLAARIAVAGGSTLEQLGIVPPPAPPPRPIPPPRPPPRVVAAAPAPPVPPPPPAPPPPPPEDVVDAVVCAAAEAIDVMPRTIRPALLAAFRRARRLGLDVAAVEKALGGEGDGGTLGSPKKTEKRGS